MPPLPPTATLTRLIRGASDTMSSTSVSTDVIHSRIPTMTSLPSMNDIIMDNTICVIGVAAVVAIIVCVVLGIACHALCLSCFGKQGFCRTPTGYTDDTLLGTVYSEQTVVEINEIEGRCKVRY